MLLLFAGNMVPSKNLDFERIIGNIYQTYFDIVPESLTEM